jgi:formylglycine-generating enzyme required for sulfatase activity
MATTFNDLLLKVKDDYGFAFLNDVEKCKSILQDRAEGGFKKEIRMFLLGVESRHHEVLLSSNSPHDLKSELIADLENKFGISPIQAEETVMLFLFTLFGKERSIEGKNFVGETDLRIKAKEGDYISQCDLAKRLEAQGKYEEAVHWYKEASNQGSDFYKQSLAKGEEPNGIFSISAFVYVKGGTFGMGSPRSEWGRDTSEEVHDVKVSEFYIGKCLITQEEYENVMKSNPSLFRGAHLPVENLSWYDAIEYCNKRSSHEGLSPACMINTIRNDPNNLNEFDAKRWVVTWLRNSDGYRQPTEAEWEFACRAGTSTPYYTGNLINTSQANFNGKGQTQNHTTKVGSFSPNPFGLYDMTGNVYEWCWDWFGAYEMKGTQSDPMGAPLGSHRTIRGGSWDRKLLTLRSAARIGSTPSLRSSEFGIRLVRSKIEK